MIISMKTEGPAACCPPFIAKMFKPTAPNTIAKTIRIMINAKAIWKNKACSEWKETNLDLSLFIAQKISGRIKPAKKIDRCENIANILSSLVTDALPVDGVSVNYDTV
jgi:hypothetical protein